MNDADIQVRIHDEGEGASDLAREQLTIDSVVRALAAAGPLCSSTYSSGRYHLVFYPPAASIGIHYR